MGKKVVVIGAGVGGLATSIRLAAQGFEVIVLEKNDFAGGKLSEIYQGPYRFDAGPSLFTLPQWVEELLALSPEPVPFAYERLEVICRYFFPDGTKIDAHADPQRFATELEQKTGIDRHRILSHFANIRERYQLTSPVFLERSFHRPGTFLCRDFWKGALNMGKLSVFETMHQENQRKFEHPKLVQLFDRYATYNGSDPYRAPATLNVIPHLEYHLGAYLPKDGMVAITQALVKTAENLQVCFKFSTPATRIEIKAGKVVGVWAGSTFYPTDLVVSNADVHFTYTHLLEGEKMPSKVSRAERSTSALVFNWGMNTDFPELDLHNIFFTENYAQEFEHLQKAEGAYEDPTVYIFISSKKIYQDAPKGHENWFTMVNVPAKSGQNWDDLIPKARKAILQKLEKQLGKSISPYITEEWILSPETIEARTNGWLGALYGTASNSKMAAFRRHSNKSPDIKGLYFVGGSVHPGGGIPLCLSSAKITAQWISENI
jgi:phytoene desaturase